MKKSAIDTCMEFSLFSYISKQGVIKVDHSHMSKKMESISKIQTFMDITN